MIFKITRYSKTKLKEMNIVKNHSTPSLPCNNKASTTTTTTTPQSNHDDVNSVRQIAFNSCKEYLGGIWKTITSKQFHIEKVSGGLTNYLYLCAIKQDENMTIQNEPKKVLLRIYGENHHNNSSILLKDVVVSSIMSQRNLGPKLYGILPMGRIEEYIESMQLTAEDIAEPASSTEIAKLLARFHTLEMPFIKEPCWLFDTMLRYMNLIETEVQFTDKEEIKKYEKLLSYDLKNEYHSLRTLLRSVDSPVVFCHNDLQPGNILKLEHTNKLVVIDYEYSSYNFRGFDLGNHFCEWMMDNNYPSFPYFACNPKLFPNKEQQLRFIREYIKQYGLLKNNEDTKPNQIQDENKILLEANYYSLASHYFWSLWAICQASTSKITFSYLDYALARMEIYYKKKEQLTKGICPPVFD